VQYLLLQYFDKKFSIKNIMGKLYDVLAKISLKTKFRIIEYLFIWKFIYLKTKMIQRGAASTRLKSSESLEVI